MAMDTVWAIDQFTFDGVTYDEDTGGPLDWDYDDSSNEIFDRVGSQVYAGAALIPERDLSVTITMRDPYTGITPGTQGNIVFTLKKNDGTSDETITFADMVYLSERGGGQKSVPAQSTLIFRYEGSGSSRIARS